MHKVQEVIVNWDFWVTKYTEDFKTQKLKFIKLTYFLIIIFFLNLAIMNIKMSAKYDLNFIPK